jgi:aldose 1-epimerase
MVVPPSGTQHEIRFGEQRATIVEVGGGIRAYDWGGRAVLDPYPVTEMCNGAHGTPLVPWPNRLADGRYRFDGADYQLPLTEPVRHNAIHGLLRWCTWQAVERSEARVVMGTRIHPQSGYPFTVEVRIAYALAADGLTVTTTATNVGDHACPFGMGQHPYLSPGGGRLDDCVVRIDASQRLETDDRGIPTGVAAVDGTPYDFRSPRPLGAMQLDTAFTGLARDGAGRAWVTLSAPDGRCAALWADEHYPVLEVFTGDTLPPTHRRRGLGGEPMTCPPNAFQSGDGVARLEPGGSATASWGVGLR